MEQRVIKVGNSLAITLPKPFTQARKLKAGQKIFVEADAELDLLQVRTKSGHFPSLTAEFKQWLDEVSLKYDKVIRELAKK